MSESKAFMDAAWRIYKERNGGWMTRAEIEARMVVVVPPIPRPPPPIPRPT